MRGAALLRILVDDTVLVEYVGERQPYCACWSKLNALELVGYAELWATPDAYRLMAESLCEEIPASEVNGALLATLDFIRICSVDGVVVKRALECDSGFDVGLLDACAGKTKADFVLSRRVASLPRSRVPVFSPEGFFEHLERDEGLVFDLVDL